MNYLGDFAEDATVRILFTTAAAAGGAVAPSSAFEADDIRIYKNNGATQKATTNGITMTSPFDSVTGLHALDIDTSNDTGDSGFWTSGAEYSVVAVPDETVDSQTVVSVIASFSIENRHANLRAILGSKLTETSAGYLTAGFKKLYDVASPVFTLASINQTGDAYAQTNQLVNGSAWVEMFGPRQVGIPQSGSRTHRVFFAVRNGRGTLTAATSLSVLAATDLAGNNVAANCSAFTTVITGVYYFDYTVANTHAETIVSVFVTGVANSSALYFQCGFAVGRFDAEDELIRYDPPTNAEMEARTLEAADYATAAALTAAPAEVITLLGSGTEVYGHSYLEAIKRIEVVAGAATLSGAGTGTEVMTSSDSSKTATFTVDGSGNVSAVVWS